MLKNSYDSQESIPENLRGAYVLSGGKWLLDELSEDHPIITKNKEVLREKSKAVSKVEELQADLDNAKGSSIPRGQVAIAKADADLLDKYKPLGPPAEIESKLAEHKTLSEKVTKQEADTKLREVAKVLSYEPEAFVRLSGLPEFEIRGEGDKKTVVAKLKDDKGVITEKPAQEFIESSSEIAPFLPALKAQSAGVRFHGTTGNGSTGKSVFDAAREVGKQHNEARKQGSSINERFGIATQ